MGVSGDVTTPSGSHWRAFEQPGWRVCLKLWVCRSCAGCESAGTQAKKLSWDSIANTACTSLAAVLPLQIDSEGKRVGKPQEETWMERASLVRDDEGNWLVREVQAIEPAAAV